MSNVTELERKRLSLREEARDILAEMRAENERDDFSVARFEALEKRHRAAMHDFDICELDLQEARDAAESQSRREANRPVSSGSVNWNGLASWDGPTVRSGWVDEKGNEVRTYAANEAIATGSAYPRVGLGDVVRAMATGPRNEFEERALSEGTNTAGGYTVPTPLAGNYIDKIRRQSVAIKAGAITVPMDSKTLGIARLDTDPTVAWRAENAALATGDPTFSRVTFDAKNLGGIITASRELLMDTANCGAMIERALVAAMSLELDRAALYGDGTSNSPTGLINMANLPLVSMGTNGALPTSYDEYLTAISTLQTANIQNITAAVLHPRTALTYGKFKDTTNQPLRIPEMAAGIPRLLSTAASITETKGTASGVCSSVLMGDFSSLMIGMRHDVQIFLLDQIYGATGQIAFAVHARMDVQCAHMESFVRIDGIKAS